MDGRPLQKALNYRMCISAVGPKCQQCTDLHSTGAPAPPSPAMRLMGWMLKDSAEPQGECREEQLDERQHSGWGSWQENLAEFSRNKLIKDSVLGSPGRETVGGAARAESGCHLLELRTRDGSTSRGLPRSTRSCKGQENKTENERTKDQS